MDIHSTAVFGYKALYVVLGMSAVYGFKQGLKNVKEGKEKWFDPYLGLAGVLFIIYYIYY